MWREQKPAGRCLSAAQPDSAQSPVARVRAERSEFQADSNRGLESPRQNAPAKTQTAGELHLTMAASIEIKSDSNGLPAGNSSKFSAI